MDQCKFSNPWLWSFAYVHPCSCDNMASCEHFAGLTEDKQHIPFTVLSY